MGAPNTARIYYSGNSFPTYFINAPISRWDEDNWDVIIETFLTSSNRDTLFAHVQPGIYSEKTNQLGWTIITDTTYNSGNTLIIEPQHPFGVSSLRESRTIVVTNISDGFITPRYFGIKIEGKRIRKWGDYS